MPMDIYVPNDVDIIHQTKVDFRKRTAQSIVHLVQYERSLPVVEVELFYNGYSYTCPNNAEVWVRWSKLDGTYVYKICQVSADRKKVYFDVDYQMSYLPGDLNPILELQIGTKMAGSSPIPISIDRNPIQDGDRESHVEDLQVEILREEVAEMQEDLDGHVNNTNNPHNITKAQVGLGNADNTSDMNKPVSTAQQAEFLKAKYHLGAFDTVDTSNADYDLITRKTGYYKFTGNEEWIEYGSGYRAIVLGNNKYLDISPTQTPTNVLSNTGLELNSRNNISAGNSGLSLTGDTIIVSSYTGLEGKVIEYETQSSYTEKVIKNQPLNTLDQQGSEFVRKEWEKTQNLYNGSQSVSATDKTNVLVELPNPITLKAGTYRLSANTTAIYPFAVFYNGTTDVGEFFLKNIIVIPSDITVNKIRFYYDGNGGSSGTYTYTNIMLNEGDHAYPYQPYNGAIVHAKDIEDVARKDVNNNFTTRQTIQAPQGSDNTLLVLNYNGTSIPNIMFGQGDDWLGYIGFNQSYKPIIFSHLDNAYHTIMIDSDITPIQDLLAELKTIVYDNQYPAVAEIDLQYATYYALPSQISGDKIIMSAGMDMTKVKGRSYVYNQAISNSSIIDTVTVAGITFTKNADYSLSISGQATYRVSYGLTNSRIPVVYGHKYLFFGMEANNQIYLIANSYNNTSWVKTFSVYDTGNGAIYTNDETNVNNVVVECVVENGTSLSKTYSCRPKHVDLTQWFGSNDAIPADLLADPSLFTKKYWKKPLPFDTGHIEDSKPVKVIATGTNLIELTNYTVQHSPAERPINITIDGNTMTAVTQLSGNGIYFPVNIKQGKTYTFSITTNNELADLCVSTTNDSSESGLVSIATNIATGSYTFTADKDYPYIRIWCRAGTTYVMSSIMLNYGSTPLPFQPFSRKEYPIIPINMGTVDLGSLDYTKIESGGGIWLFMAQVAGKAIGTRYNHAWCEGLTRWDNSAWLMPDKTAFSCEVENTSIYFKNTDFVDATSFKQFMRGKMLTYELATQTHHALRSAGSVQDDNEKVKIANIVLDNSDNDHRFTYKSSANTTHAYKCGEILCDPLSNQVYPNIMCDKFTPVKSNDGFAGAIGIMISGQGEVYISFGLDSNFDTLEKANTWLQSNNVSINYYLTSPTDQSPSFALPENIEIQKGGTIEIEYDDGYSTPCDFDFEVAVSKVLEE